VADFEGHLRVQNRWNSAIWLSLFTTNGSNNKGTWIWYVFAMAFLEWGDSVGNKNYKPCMYQSGLI